MHILDEVLLSIIYYVLFVNNHVEYHKDSISLDGPDKCEINTTSPYIIMEGYTTETIKCKADCYPSCACVWRNESSGSSIRNESFVIRTVSKYQTGNYTCTCTNTAKDKIATEQTSSLYIKVECKLICYHLIPNSFSM
jgi:hypothetical protein